MSISSPATSASDRSESLLALGALVDGDHIDTWSAAERDRLRWKLVHWRDEGRREDAIAALRLAARQWPNDPVFLLELLVLQLTTPDLDLQAELDSASRDCLTHPEIALILGHHSLLAGDLSQARLFLDAIGDLPRERMTPFAALYRDLLQGAGLEPARARYVATAQNAPAPLETSEAADLIQVLAFVMVHADRYESLFDVVRAVMYFDTLEAPLSQHIVLRAMELAGPRLSIDGKAIRLQLMGATYGPVETLPIIRNLLNQEGSRTSARFARTASTIAARAKDGALEREILCRFTPAGADQTRLEAAQTAEILTRRKTLGLEHPLEVFVGFFGQMREPEAVMPAAVTAIQEAFDGERYGRANLHFALSTWPRTGGRALSLHDAAGFFAQAAPPEMRDLLTSRLGASGQALASRLPHLVGALIDHSVRKAARDTTPAELGAYLPDGAIVTMSPESEIEEEVRPGLARINRDHPATINQLKMWSRIGALREPLLAHEAKLGRPVDVCLLIRCDLARVQGSLGELAARAASPYEDTAIFYDYDPHAEFIAGSGDRYMLGSRRSIEPLLGGYAHYLDVVRTEPTGPLSERIEAHSGVQSLMVLNGLTPSPVWALGYELHRGAPPAASLVAALQADYENSSDQGLRREIAAILAPLAPQSTPL